MEHKKDDRSEPWQRHEALLRHQQVLEHTRSVLTRWMWIIGINFLTHFMRMGVVISYMTGNLGASKFDAGAVVTAHLTVIGVANAYLSFSMDSHSFESMITLRFGLLTLFTLGEWLARDFTQFAVVYVAASLAIVWLAVSDAYFVQMLPPAEAKALSILGANVNRGCIMVGLALGGCIGGFLSMNAVFLGSFIIAAMSLFFILIFVIGREQDLKQAQQTEIVRVYQEFPDEFIDPANRFPIPWLKNTKNDIEENRHNQQGYNAVSERSESDAAGVQRSPVKPPMINDDNVGGEPTDRDCLSWITLVFLLLNAGLRTAQIVEIITWWNVYATEVFDVSIAKSTGQMVIATLCGIPALWLFSRMTGASTMQLPSLLNNGIVVYTLSGVVIVFMFIFIFPNLGFNAFWVAYPILFVISTLVDPYRLAFQVIESPAHEAGSVFALIILSRSIIPAVQHIIIGALWNEGDKDEHHPWFFIWFGILNGMSTLMFIFYWLCKLYFLNYQTDRQLYHVVP